MILKCDSVRTHPMPLREGQSPSLYDEYKVLQKLYALAEKLKEPQLVAKPGRYFPNLFGACYSMNLLGSPEVLSTLDFVRLQKESKSPQDTPEFWHELFGIRPLLDSKQKQALYQDMYETLTKKLMQLVTAVPYRSLTSEESKRLKQLLGLFHQQGYVHGDLVGNLLQWQDAKSAKHIGIIDPLGFRPSKHYGQDCLRVHRRTCLTKDPVFQQLRQQDEDSLLQLSA
jgi:hypothetical protein